MGRGWSITWPTRLGARIQTRPMFAMRESLNRDVCRRRRNDYELPCSVDMYAIQSTSPRLDHGSQLTGLG